MKVVFDFGGVVFRWRPEVLMRRCLPKRVQSPEDATLWAGRFFQHYAGDWGEFDRGAVHAGELVERIARRTGLSPEEVQRVVDAVPDELEPIAPTLALIGRIKEAGHRLYFLSNMPAPYAAELRRRHRFLEWFDDGVFSSEVRLVKPDPSIFQTALQRFRAQARDCVFLDDHPRNVEVARELGWQAVHFVDAAQAALALGDLGVLRTPRAS